MSNAAPVAATSSNAVVRAYVDVIENNHRMALKALEGVSPEQALQSATPGGTHILWLAGHLAWALDELVVQGFGRKPSMLPADWGKLFAMGTKTTPNAADYPPFADVRAHLEKVAQAAREQLQSWTDDTLNRPLPDDYRAKDFFGTHRGFLRAFSFHDAYHIGQIGLLRRIAGAPSVFGF
jgi:hypothetical protein